MLPKVSEDRLRALHGLAADVRDTLAEAGLPMTGDLAPGLRVGVRVEVDPADDEAGGVWVDWHTHPRLAEAAADCVNERRLDDPVLTRQGEVMEAMQQAMLAILTAAGFQAGDPDHDYRPYELQVTAGPRP
ncbi:MULTISPECIES: hypothetical protein [unclassified Crossiella]|uniref:hypothetical protein n=1 Tax=unclassified Crossiella TaxID=2620835 RepID=UPI001FFF9503|nr:MULTISPECIES: hypothetical protein [unclassified Crossiella]MCK2243024.1 hypothetical protein [Crossiella sp. S99.2]MCK2256901.1 hypothetical protein [Crossiella sp. S99.1]